VNNPSSAEKWWSAKGEINPVRWELEERVRKTKKLEKALRHAEEEGELSGHETHHGS
jgi:hypothetical protein